MTNPSIQLPEKFLQRLETFVPEDKLQDVLQSFSTKRPTTFRVNTLKIGVVELTNKLQSQGFQLKPVSWYKEAFILENKSKKELLETDEYKNGLLYMQNLSSMLPSLVLDPQDNEIILDMAASPGSKTTQLATLMHNTGTIIANDKSPKRLFKLLENLKTQGVTNTKTSAIPGEFLWKKYPEYFDKVLVDAPCTMEGRFTLLDPDSYKDWSPRKVKELSNLQKWMLRSAISCTKVGGTIVYSTCTMSPEENEEVINWIVKKLGDAISIEKITMPNFFTSLQDTTSLRIYPDTIMEGFFVAKIKKHTTTIVIQ